VLDQSGQEVIYPMQLSFTESVLSQLKEPHLYPVLSGLRETICQWRFYHHFRTDAHSPIRYPQIGIRTPVLDNEGIDLAAALQTIIEVGDEDALYSAIDEAFPGSRLFIQVNQGQFSIQLAQPGIKRPLDAKELSDGTLRYLCLIAALLSPRPPKFLALNEPEMSLHPDLMAPLANLIKNAAGQTQIWVTTHSKALVKHLSEYFPESTLCLYKSKGETEVVPY